MKISYDPNVDAMSIRLNDKKYKVSREIVEGVIVDLTEDNEIIAIEILDASTREINPYEVVCKYYPPTAQKALDNKATA
jgi:uncharacterized protein YuzE